MAICVNRAIAGEPADFEKLPATQPISGARALEMIAARG
jgi:leucyl/phenylalanyl-tRNA---protein transferase